jgi:hypothetical protein
VGHPPSGRERPLGASQPTDEANGLPDLVNVLLAAVTDRQVGYEAAVAVGVELAVEVTGDELDDAAALESDHGVTLPPC